MAKRIGPVMEGVADYVRRHPGALAIRIVEDYAGQCPNGYCRGHGYDAINRTLAAGLIAGTDCAEANCERPAKHHRHFVPMA